MLQSLWRLRHLVQTPQGREGFSTPVPLCSQTKGAVSYMERRKAAVSIANDIAFKAGLQASFEHAIRREAGTIRHEHIMISTPGRNQSPGIKCVAGSLQITFLSHVVPHRSLTPL